MDAETTATTEVDPYADLPEWARPGANCWIVFSADTSAIQTPYKAIITKILKRDVVVTYTTRGTELTERIPRDRNLTLYRSSGRGAAQLYPVGAPEVANLRAVNIARSLPGRIEKIASGYGESVTRGVQRKPLRTADDAASMIIDMQDELERVLRLVQKLAAETHVSEEA
jgi:hypothetical protein